MTLKLMYITNNEEVAKIAEKNDVDGIFVDLEINGKEERQGHLDTVISRHQIEDVKRIKSILYKSKLLVRVNPIFEGSDTEIERVINDGADIIILPFFKTSEEVEEFLNYVGGRAKTMLLLETPQAVDCIDNILNLDGIDYIHIGLNDLHLGYNMVFMFELLANGMVEKLTKKIKAKKIPYGFGGIARLGEGDLPSENIIGEHYRLGSSMVILSRSFCNENSINNIKEAENLFKSGVSEIRELEKTLKRKNPEFFEKNRLKSIEIIKSIKNR